MQVRSEGSRIRVLLRTALDAATPRAVSVGQAPHDLRRRPHHPALVDVAEGGIQSQEVVHLAADAEGGNDEGGVGQRRPGLRPPVPRGAGERARRQVGLTPSHR